MYFIITTNREVAEQIERQCAFDEKFGDRSYKLVDISHHEGHSDVQIVSKDEQIKGSDIFWLGHFSAQVPYFPPPVPSDNLLLSENRKLKEANNLLQDTLDGITLHLDGLYKKIKVPEINYFPETVKISEIVKIPETIKP